MNTETHTMPRPTKKPSRLNGILIPAVIILPMVVAYIMFYTGWGVPLMTTNKGEFLSPPQLVTELKLANNDTQLSDAFAEGSQKRWRLLIPVSANCVDACADNLYLTRQVHIRLAQKAYRVERVLVLLGDFSPLERSALEEAHPTTMMVATNTADFSQWLAPIGLNTSEALAHYYLVDQNGYAMMRYDNTHSGQDLLSDVKKLLKYTYDK